MRLLRRTSSANTIRFDGGVPRRRRPLFVDVLSCAAIVALAAIFLDAKARDQARAEAVDAAREALRAIEREVGLRAVLAGAAGDEIAYPSSIDPSWFGDQRPLNPLLEPDRPWIEVAPQIDRDLRHPRSPVASDRNAAMFWYNPANGVIRARVPEALSESYAIQLYNRLNRTRLRELSTISCAEDRESGR